MQAHWEHQLITLAGSFHTPAKPTTWHASQPSFEMGMAFDICAAVAKEHSKSFFMATALLPQEKREAVRVLYAFCRIVDDIVDESTAEDRDVQLAYWRSVVAGLRAPEDGDMIAKAWLYIMRKHHIPARYALQLIDGVARDLGQVRYETFEDLSTYCYGVASTVGLMSMYIIGFRSTEALRYAINLGVALQLTNILRDVGEDARNGRVYLPAQELQAFGISEAELLEGKLSPKWLEFMKYQIFRVRDIYAEAEKGIPFLEADGQLAVAAASGFYRAILDVIEENKYDVFTRRASLGALRKLAMVPSILRGMKKI